MSWIFPVVMGMAFFSIVGLFLLQMARIARYDRQNQQAKEAIERIRNKHHNPPDDTR